MRRVVYFGALVTTLAMASPVSAQITSGSSVAGGMGEGPWRINAVIGSSFGTLGTAPSSVAAAGYDFGNGWTIGGEAGTFRGNPLERPAVVGSGTAPRAIDSSEKVNAYHFNANLTWQLPEADRFAPYVTGGVGTFRTSMVAAGTPATAELESYERATHAATNVGAGLTYRLNRWLGIGADYRLFVFNTNDAHRVNRFTTGVSILLR